MYTNNQGYWNDQNCGIETGRICKRPEGATLPPAKTTVDPDGHCPDGWVHAGVCVAGHWAHLSNDGGVGKQDNDP